MFLAFQSVDIKMSLRNAYKILAMVFLLTITNSSCINSREEFEFINIASIWRKGHLFEIEECLFFSFGYDRELPFMKIDLSLDGNDIDISLKTNGMEAPSGCSIVLIAGKYVQQVNEVMERMESIAEQTQFLPLAAFIFEE